MELFVLEMELLGLFRFFLGRRWGIYFRDSEAWVTLKSISFTPALPHSI